jgi:transcription elongation factor S-II
MASLSTVVGLKKSLAKLVVSVDNLEASQVEEAQDLLNQLDQCEMNLDLLSQSLIGTVVSKFKAHDTLGPSAKKLVKKWKQIAKGGGSSNGSQSAKAIAAAASPPNPGKMERRDSTGSATAAAEEEWSMLQPIRQTTCRKIRECLLSAKADLVKDGINATAVDHLAVQRATEIESAIQLKDGKDRTEYTGKARSLCFNLKKNKKLAGEVILGTIGATDLVNMSTEELASEEKRKEMEARKEKMLDQNRLDWDQANEKKINDMCGIKGDLLKASLFTCGRCKSVKTTSTQKQTRSADEPMTVFVLCLNCGKRWKC